MVDYQTNPTAAALQTKRMIKKRKILIIGGSSRRGERVRRDHSSASRMSNGNTE